MIAVPHGWRTPGGWHHHVERAQIEELVWRDRSGRVHFRGQRPTGPKRFRERVWPVFSRVRRPRQTTDAWYVRRLRLPHVTYERSMTKAHRVEAGRRWWVGPPLTRHWDRVDDAISATRGTRA
jgi:hypothetical protein